MTKHLWAPWRMEYIVNSSNESGCILCSLQDKSDKESLILTRNKIGFVMLNRFPYSPGHLMVVPFKHICSLTKLKSKEHAEFWELVKNSIEMLKKAISPEGFNVGINLNRCSGAGIEDHLHVHIVPRWNGDTNFMPVIADIKVVPEYLEKTWKKLYPFFQELNKK